MADKKALIMDVFHGVSQPLALSEIAEKLDRKIPERTIQRFLKQLVDSGTLLAVGQKRGRKYQLKPNRQVVNTPESGGFEFSASVSPVIKKISQHQAAREPCTYRPEWLSDYAPDHSFYLPADLRQQLKLYGQQVSIGLPAGTYAHQIFAQLLIDLSYHSSRLEGNTYSLPDTERLLLAGEVMADKSDNEKIMLLNHKEAIRFLVDGINRLEVTTDNIRSLHYLLADGLVPAGAAGGIRHEMVRIFSTTYIPMTGQERLTRQLDEITRLARQISDPFEQSFFLLVHISYLQAFVDVNKRTARLACNIPLVKQNLVPLSFNDIAQDDYASAILAVYEQNDVRPLAELYQWSYLRSCKQYEVTAESLGVDVLRVQYRQMRRDMIRQIVQQDIHGDEVDQLIRSVIVKVPAVHQYKVWLDMQIDLKQLAPHTIAGMGITQQELADWLQYDEGIGIKKPH